MKPEGSLTCHNAVHIFSHVTAVHVTTVHASHPISLRSTYNIILSSIPASSKRALPFGVPYQIFVCISFIKYNSACNVTFVQVITA